MPSSPRYPVRPRAPAVLLARAAFLGGLRNSTPRVHREMPRKQTPTPDATLERNGDARRLRLGIRHGVYAAIPLELSSDATVATCYHENHRCNDAIGSNLALFQSSRRDVACANMLKFDRRAFQALSPKQRGCSGPEPMGREAVGLSATGVALRIADWVVLDSQRLPHPGWKTSKARSARFIL